jgi:hypothetical protein
VFEEKDFRIASMFLSSLRGIEDKIDDIPYGIDFMNHSKIPCNAVIVGNNGAGKTSIFSALEYIYANMIDEAALREFSGNGSDRLYEYLKRAGGSNDPFCEIKTVKNVIYDIKKGYIVKILKRLPIPRPVLLANMMSLNMGGKTFRVRMNHFTIKSQNYWGSRIILIFTNI